jgi:hypothetical protein
VPVIGVGRITSPELAERALEDGLCDAVALGRALLADPDWVRKARAGRTAEIRPCIATVQGCAGMLQFGDPISCQVNPEVGRELRSQPSSTSRPAAVAVVGGGPAGMEAALRAARLGHSVVLFERAAALGGALRLAANTPPLQSFGRLIAWYESQLAAAGVDVRLGLPAPNLAAYELVICAPGARSEVPMLEGYDEIPVWILEDLDEASGATRPAILGGASWAMAAALKLAADGARPVVVDATGFGRDTSGLARRAFLARLERAGVELVVGRVEKLTAKGVRLEGGRFLSADGVVLAGRRLPERVAGVPETAIWVGDGREPRGIGAAIAEAREAVDAWAQMKSPPASQRSKVGRVPSATSSSVTPDKRPE